MQFFSGIAKINFSVVYKLVSIKSIKSILPIPRNTESLISLPMTRNPGSISPISRDPESILLIFKILTILLISMILEYFANI